MNGITVLLALAAVGVDYGWQPGADGQLEYIVQIEPGALDALHAGKVITSEIHPDARGVRRFRIQVGTDPLPRIGVLSANTSPTSLSTSPGTAALSDEPASRTALGDGILRLPPPPALIGPDGMASVLVRPGDRALPGTTGSANPSVPIYDGTPPATDGMDSLSVPLTPPAGGGNWSNPPSAPGGFGPTSPGTVFPVPGAGPETGLPAPIRGAGLNRNGAAAEDTAENAAAQPPSTTDLLNQLAADRGEAAANKPAIDKDEAERLLDERLKQLQAEHPWAPLVLTSLALFGSLAANVYLGWIAAGVYRRYREMCDELHEAQASLT